MWWSVHAREPAELFTALAVGAAVKYAFSYWLSKNKPERKVGKVSDLLLFPVKSFGGISLKSAECTKLGLSYNGLTDRHWVVAQKNGAYLTQRLEPRMALVSTSIHGSNLHFDAPGMDTLVLPIKPDIEKSKLGKVTVKDDTVEALDCGDAAAAWISKFMKIEGLRVFCTPPGLEKRDSSKAVKTWKHAALPGDMTAFTDFCAYMMLSDSSIEALNKRLDFRVTSANFRANIMVDACPAFAEDTWKSVRIGKATFRQLDSCTRCVLVTVDPETGAKYRNDEPLKTLKEFRLKHPYGQKPAFGIDCALDMEGTVKIGDPVYATPY